MQSKDIGFNKNNVVIVDQAYALKANLDPYLNYLKSLEQVESVGGVGASLGEREWDSMRLQPEESNEVLTVKFMLMNDDFVNTIGFKFKEGRAFSKEFNDSLSIILNETAVQTLSLKNPIGKRLTNNTASDDGSLKAIHYTVVGVVKDFNFQPLHDQITPLAIVSSDSYGGFYPSFAVKLNGKNVASVVQQMEVKWKELAPGKLFRFSFLEERMNQQYADEQRSEKLFVVFTTIALVIGCVGIFGLSLYTTSSRTKELSIRKVLGASVKNLTVLLTKNFIQLILIAVCIAVPVSSWLMSKWLQGFAYRVESIGYAYIIASSATLLLPLIIVCYQSVRAALTSPIKSLKSE
jgi:putative ABC transport system permease protein